MKITNKIRLLMLLSAVLAVAVSCAKNNGGDDMDEKGSRREVLSGQQDVEKDADATDSTPSAGFIMRLEDTTLTLYEISGGEETAVTAISIDPSYYPSDDIEELNRGVVAYSKEEGFARLENYTN